MRRCRRAARAGPSRRRSAGAPSSRPRLAALHREGDGAAGGDDVEPEARRSARPLRARRRGRRCRSRGPSAKSPRTRGARPCPAFVVGRRARSRSCRPRSACGPRPSQRVERLAGDAPRRPRSGPPGSSGSGRAPSRLNTSRLATVPELAVLRGAFAERPRREVAARASERPRGRRACVSCVPRTAMPFRRFAPNTAPSPPRPAWRPSRRSSRSGRRFSPAGPMPKNRKREPSRVCTAARRRRRRGPTRSAASPGGRRRRRGRAATSAAARPTQHERVDAAGLELDGEAIAGQRVADAVGQGRLGHDGELRAGRERRADERRERDHERRLRARADRRPRGSPAAAATCRGRRRRRSDATRRPRAARAWTYRSPGRRAGTVRGDRRRAWGQDRGRASLRGTLAPWAFRSPLRRRVEASQQLPGRVDDGVRAGLPQLRLGARAPGHAHGEELGGFARRSRRSDDPRPWRRV